MTRKFLLKWQNNSGGYFVQDENNQEYIFIEFESSEEEPYVKQIIDNLDHGYCECCGPRWDSFEEVQEVDNIYDLSVESIDNTFSICVMKENLKECTINLKLSETHIEVDVSNKSDDIYSELDTVVYLLDGTKRYFKSNYNAIESCNQKYWKELHTKSE